MIVLCCYSPKNTKKPLSVICKIKFAIMIEGYANLVYDNACAQKPPPRPDDGQRTVNNHPTVMREEYAEIAAHGGGLL